LADKISAGGNIDRYRSRIGTIEVSNFLSQSLLHIIDTKGSRSPQRSDRYGIHANIEQDQFCDTDVDEDQRIVGYRVLKIMLGHAASCEVVEFVDKFTKDDIEDWQSSTACQ
jgi:hypothetical protein